MGKLGAFLDRLIRFIFRIAVYLLSIGIVILGSHGLYVYASRIEVLFGAITHKLFLTMNTPALFHAMINWMSIKGFESWIIPTAFIIVGVIIWKFEVDIEYFVFRKIPNSLRF